MRRAILGLGLISALVLASVPVALSHHSFAVAYDSSNRATKQGFVTKVEWANPHAWVYFDVKDAATGNTENWGCEIGPPDQLVKSGVRRDTLKYGAEIVVTGSLAKNGSRRMNAGNNGLKVINEANNKIATASK